MVDQQSTLNDPTPSLRSHYRTLTATTGRSALLPRRSVSPLPRRSARLGSFPVDTAMTTTAPVRGEEFSCSMSKPGPSSRHLYAGHRRGRKQITPRLIPEKSPIPGFDVISCVTTRHQRFTHVRLLDPHLPPSTRRLFHDAHHHGSFTAATHGGLEPPSAGRPRRTYLHLRHSTMTNKLCLLHQNLPITFRTHGGTRTAGSRYQYRWVLLRRTRSHDGPRSIAVGRYIRGSNSRHL
jgi:hypothetical protein